MNLMRTLASATATLVSSTAHATIHSVESTAVGMVTIITSVATLTLNDISPWGFDDELKLTLIPFIGSLPIVMAVFWLNPEIETRRIVAGRSSVALFLGSLGPQVISIIFPITASFIAHPIISLVLGGMLGALGYILAKPFCTGAYKRSKETANKILDQAEAVARRYTMDAVKQQLDDTAPERKKSVMAAVKEQTIEDLPTQHQAVKSAVREAIHEEGIN